MKLKGMVANPNLLDGSMEMFSMGLFQPALLARTIHWLEFVLLSPFSWLKARVLGRGCFD